MKNTYAIFTQGVSKATRVQAESFHFSSDGKVAFFTTDGQSVAAFPADKLIGIIADTAFVKREDKSGE